MPFWVVAGLHIQNKFFVFQKIHHFCVVYLILFPIVKYNGVILFFVFELDGAKKLHNYLHKPKLRFKPNSPLGSVADFLKNVGFMGNLLLGHTSRYPILLIPCLKFQALLLELCDVSSHLLKYSK